MSKTQEAKTAEAPKKERKPRPEKPVRFAANTGWYPVVSGWYDHSNPGARKEIPAIGLYFEDGISQPLFESKAADKAIIDAFREHIAEGTDARIQENGLCELKTQVMPPAGAPRWAQIESVDTLRMLIDANKLHIQDCRNFEESLPEPREAVLDMLDQLEEEPAENDPFAGEG